MIETSHNACIAAAYRKAHSERAQAFAALFHWVAAKFKAPLNQPVLTEPSRCA
ncbi:hypothetical protein [Shimia biformata]|uniref:hypothetical protein n=1 Tax=Shimia biformata TaxID=1294299 RepID=UPI001951A53C|nr:hypothetical protein [Shimia biformata]